MNRKHMVWGGMGAIVVVAIVVVVNNPYPPKGDLSGAVGATQQYRSNQITDADVVLQDPEIQDLLQSDFFHKLATDDAFRKVAVDQLARLNVVDGRGAQFTNPASLADMDNFLGVAVANPELKTAMASGRMDVVQRILVAENRVALMDVANRIFLAQGSNAELNARMYADMKSFVGEVSGSAELKSALAEGRMDVVNRVLAADGRSTLSEAAGRVFQAESRNMMSGRMSNLAEMRVFLDLSRTNVELRTAIAEGRLDIVNKMLLVDGRTNLTDVANRVCISLARTPELNAAALEDMRAFIDLAASNGDLKAAIVDGRLEVVNRILVAENKTGLSAAAGRVFAADGRSQVGSQPSFADMKAVFDLSRTNVEMRSAIASGRLDIVNKVLAGEGRTNLVDAAHSVYLSLGRNPELNALAIDDMRAFIDVAAGNADLKAAITDGRLDVVNRVLAAEGKVALADAAGRVYLAANRCTIEGRTFNTSDMRVFLELAKVNLDLHTAMAEGRMDIVQRVLMAGNRTELADAANRVYLGLGRSPDLNAAAIEDMRTFLDTAAASPDLKVAMAEGRLDLANRILIADGKIALADAAGRVFLAADPNGRLGLDSAVGDMRVVASFAAENGEFRQMLQDGRLDAAARVALAAGRSEVSLRSLQAARFVVGNSRSFVTDLDRLVAVADTPTFKQVALNAGWGRMLATTDAASWKVTMESVSEGRMFNQN